jgi:hypothetical protein
VLRQAEGLHLQMCVSDSHKERKTVYLAGLLVKVAVQLLR